MTEINSIFKHSHCISKSQMLSYIREQLDKDEAHLVESHLNDCQLCNDALDALMEADLAVADQHIREVKAGLMQKFNTTAAAFPAGGEAPHLKAIPNIVSRKKNPFTRWLAAASILFLVGLGGYSVFSYIQSQQNELSLKEGKTGKTTSDAPYTESPDASGELVTIRVSPEDSFPLSEERNKIDPEAKVTGLEKNPRVVADKSIAKIPMEDRESKDAVSMEEPNILQKEQVSPVENKTEIEPQAGMENYIRGNNDAKYEESVKSLSMKKSRGGLKNERDANVQNNQMNYPKGYQNNDVQINAAGKPQVQNAESDRNNEEISVNNFQKAKDLFNQQDYRGSISFFEKALKNASAAEKEDIKYLLALAYLRSGKERKAGRLFEELESSTRYGKEASQQRTQMSQKK